jgi:hypothetical protein
VSTLRINEGTVVPRASLLDEDPDDDDIAMLAGDQEDDPLNYNSGYKPSSALSLAHFSEGLSASLRSELETLVLEFEDIFKNELKSEHALVPAPLTVNINKQKWEVPKNKLPPRSLSTSKQKELREQIEMLLRLDVIKASEAEYHSQVPLVPKPNGSWRFCIDYRNLNKCIKSQSWPIPNIRDMLRRLGDQKAKYFTKIV